MQGFFGHLKSSAKKSHTVREEIYIFNNWQSLEKLKLEFLISDSILRHVY